MNFHILTLFPDMVRQGLSTSIIGRAAENGLLSIDAVNIRDYTLDKHKKVDDYPYGGGAGMLMQAQPVYDAWKSVADRVGHRPRTIYLTPQGPTFTQQMAKDFAKEEDLVFLCGHYEGIDERVLEEIVTDYVSIGDYVLTGGELPAMVMVDAISRMVPGVLTNDVSGITESFEGDLLEYPQYSRPEEWMGKKVPAVLLSGNQKKIEAWRRQEAEKRTKERRPDMYEKYEELQNCCARLRKNKLLHIGMTELVVRGQAHLVYEAGENICIKDKVSGIYFLTAEDIEGGKKILEFLVQKNEEIDCLMLHQEFMVEPAERHLGLQKFLTAYQAVYTRKEKLPIAGLYSLEQNKKEGLLQIRRLGMEWCDWVAERYEAMDDPEYIKDRIEKGFLFGGFAQDTLVGFVGMHQEGSLGFLTVLPEYRGRGYGRALSVFMMNYALELGVVPFGQVEIHNERQIQLQTSLNVCFSKTPVYFLEKDRNL